MAKPKKELSDAEKKLSDLKVKLDTAVKADGEKSSEKTVAAVAAAKAAVAEQSKIVNRDRFVRVAGGRVNKARAAIKNLANVAAPRSYTYDETDIAKAEKVLLDGLNATIAKLRSALTASSGAAKSKTGEENPFA